MASLIDSRGLEVVSPDPTGVGGKAINDNFIEIAKRSGPFRDDTVDPTVNDDSADTSGKGKFFIRSTWLNTATGAFFINVDATPTAAVWTKVLTADAVKLEGDLDLNGNKILTSIGGGEIPIQISGAGFMSLTSTDGIALLRLIAAAGNNVALELKRGATLHGDLTADGTALTLLAKNGNERLDLGAAGTGAIRLLSALDVQDQQIISTTVTGDVTVKPDKCFDVLHDGAGEAMRIVNPVDAAGVVFDGNAAGPAGKTFFWEIRNLGGSRAALSLGGSDGINWNQSSVAQKYTWDVAGIGLIVTWSNTTPVGAITTDSTGIQFFGGGSLDASGDFVEQSYTTATEPSFGTAGRHWFNTDLAQFTVDTGAALVRLGAGGGVSEDVIQWNLTGSITTGTAVEGLRAARRAGTIKGVIVTAENRGNTGTSLFDLNLHVPTKPITIQRNNTSGTTIYTTQGNRPSIVGLTGSSSQNAIHEAPLPDVTAFAAGDFFSLDVDASMAQLTDVTIFVFVEYS